MSRNNTASTVNFLNLLCKIKFITYMCRTDNGAMVQDRNSAAFVEMLQSNSVQNYILTLKCRTTQGVGRASKVNMNSEQATLYNIDDYLSDNQDNNKEVVGQW